METKNRMAAGLIALACVLSAATAFAGRYWTGSGANAYWSTQGNWSENEGGPNGTSAPTADSGSQVYFYSAEEGHNVVLFDCEAAVQSNKGAYLATGSTLPIVWAATDADAQNPVNGLTISHSDGLHINAYKDHGLRSPAYLTIESGVYSLNNVNLCNMDGMKAGLKVNGGRITTGDLYVGRNKNTEASLEVNGGSITATTFVIGGKDGGRECDDYAYASMVMNGGTLSATKVFLGGYVGQGCRSDMIVNDGQINVGEVFYVSVGGDATLTMNGGAITLANSDAGFTLCHTDKGNATVVINGGTITASKIRTEYLTGDAHAELIFNGATLKATRRTEQFMNASPNLTCEIREGGLTIDTAGFEYVTITQGFSGIGGITKKGEGKLLLKGDNTFAGDVVVEEGTVEYFEPITSKVVIDGSEGGALATPLRIHRKPFIDWLTDPAIDNFSTEYNGNGRYDDNTPRIVEVDFGGAEPLAFTNLMIGMTYNWTGEKPDGTTVSGSFITSAQPPRTALIPVPGSTELISNVRDIGGWPLIGTTAGGETTVRQGLVFRGACPDPYYALSSEEKDANPLYRQLGVRTEIDLRGNNSDFVNGKRRLILPGEDGTIESESYYYDGSSPETAINYSEACPHIRYYLCPMDNSTVDGDISNNSNYSPGNMTNQVRRVFHLLAGSLADNQPVYFHCKIGCDRTGFIAMLLEGLIGAGEEVLFRDYLTSSFSNVGDKRDTARTANFLDQIYSGAAGKYVWVGEGRPDYGYSLAGRCRAYLEMCGVTSAEIAAITQALTGETPEQVLARVAAYDLATNSRVVSFIPSPGCMPVAIRHVSLGNPPVVPTTIADQTRTSFTWNGWDYDHHVVLDEAGTTAVLGKWTLSKAGTSLWTGLGGDTNWSTPGNWSPEDVPAGEVFVDDSAGDRRTINFDSDAAINGSMAIYGGSDLNPTVFTASTDATLFSQTNSGNAEFRGTVLMQNGRWILNQDISNRKGTFVINGADVRTGYYVYIHESGKTVVNSGSLVAGFRDGAETHSGHFEIGKSNGKVSTFEQNGGYVRCSARDDDALLAALLLGAAQSTVYCSLNGGEMKVDGATYAAYADGSVADLTIDGCELSETENFYIGHIGTAAVSMESGRVMVGTEAEPRETILGSSSGVGTLALRGGTWHTSSISAGGSPQTSTLLLDGGVAVSLADGVFLPSQNTLEVSVGANGAVFDTDGHDISVQPVLVGPGALVKRGAGTLTLDEMPDLDGGCRVEEGRLVLPAGVDLGSLYLGPNASIEFIIDTLEWSAGHKGALFTGTLAAGSAALSADNVFVRGVPVGFVPEMHFDDISEGLYMTMGGNVLVWAGVSGANWNGPYVWRDLATGGMSSYSPGRAVSFEASSFGDADRITVTVTSEVAPAGLNLALPAGKVLRIGGGGKISPEVVTASKDAELMIDDAELELPESCWPSGTLTITGDGQLDPDVPFSNGGRVRVATAADATVSFAGVGGVGTVEIASGTLQMAGSISGRAEVASRLVYTADATACAYSGDGIVELSNARLTVAAPNEFVDFAGTIVVPSGSALVGASPWDSPEYLFGTNTLFRMEGGVLGDFAVAGGSNTEQLGGVIEFVDGTVSQVSNTVAQAGSGNGVAHEVTANITGGGDAVWTIASNKTRFYGDHSEFTGTLTFHGTGDDSHVYLDNASTSSPTGTYVFTGTTLLHINIPSDTTLEVGAIRAASTLKEFRINHTINVLIGGNGGDCEISAPVTTRKILARKIGSGDLLLGENFTTLADSTLAMDEGALVLAAGAEQNLAMTFAEGTTIRSSGIPFVTTGAVTGLAGTTVELAEGLDYHQRHTLISAASIDGTPAKLVTSGHPFGRWNIELVDGEGGTKAIEAWFEPRPLFFIVR